MQLVHAGNQLWDNFPHSVATPQVARYVNAFLGAFNHAELSDGEQHAL